MRRQFNAGNNNSANFNQNNGYPPQNNGYPPNYYNQQPNQYYQQTNPNGGYQQPPIPPKKPVYKKWWFWLAIAVAFIVLVAFIFGRPKKENYSAATLEKDFSYIENQYNNVTIHLNDKNMTDKKIIKKSTDAKEKIQKKINLLKLNQSYPNITSDLIDIGENEIIVLQSLIDQANGKRLKSDMKSVNKVYKLTNKFIDKYFESSKHQKQKSKSSKIKNNSSDNSVNNKKVNLQFGQTADLINGDKIIQMQVETVKNVDPNDSMVTDISHNYPNAKQFVIVTYKVTAEKGDIDLNQFDGSELLIADATGEIGTQSSNRDNGIPQSLSQGQNITLRIGVGFNNTGNTSTVKFLGNTWSGNIS